MYCWAAEKGTAGAAGSLIVLRLGGVVPPSASSSLLCSDMFFTICRNAVNEPRFHSSECIPYFGSPCVLHVQYTFAVQTLCVCTNYQGALAT